MKKNKIEFFYESIATNKDLQKKIQPIVEKMKESKNLKDIIENKLIPLANNYGFNLTLNDFLNEETELKQNLDLSELQNISGGISVKPFMFTTLTLFGLLGISAASGQAFADDIPNSGENVILSKDSDEESYYNSELNKTFTELQNAGGKNVKNDNGDDSVVFEANGIQNLNEAVLLSKDSYEDSYYDSKLNKTFTELQNAGDRHIKNDNGDDSVNGIQNLNEAVLLSKDSYEESYYDSKLNKTFTELQNAGGKHIKNDNSDDSIDFWKNEETYDYQKKKYYVPSKFKTGKDSDNTVETAKKVNNDKYVATIENGKSYDSLEGAINEAEDGDIITIDKDIILDHEIKINKSIMVTANRTRTIQRAANYTGNLFKIIDSAVTIGGSNAESKLILDGAGVKNCESFINCTNSILNLKNTNIYDNFSKDNGGAISTFSGQLNLLWNVEIFNNFAKYGGAIFSNSSKLSFSDDIKFHDNKAVDGGGAVYLAGGEFSFSGKTEFYNNSSKLGGALFINDIKKLLLNGENKFHHNNATEDGGAIFIAKGELDILGKTEFYNNLATDGGAVWFNKGQLNISGQTKFYNNSATNGGAVLCKNRTDISITDNVIFYGNKATKNAGAIHLNEARVNISGQVEFSSNSAYLGGVINCSQKSEIIIKDKAYIHDNKAHSNGGVVWIESGIIDISGETEICNNSAHCGGAVLCYNKSIISLRDNIKIHNNEAIFGGGAFSIDKGILRVLGKAKIYENKATLGGAFFCSPKNIVSLGENVEIYNNTANENGGAFHSNNVEFHINGKIKVYNNKAENGAAFFCANYNTISLNENAKIYGNIANENGGAIYLDRGEISILDKAEIFNNKASVYGYGIYNVYGKLNIPDSSRVHNNGRDSIIYDIKTIDLISSETDAFGNRYKAQIRNISQDEEGMDSGAEKHKDIINSKENSISEEDIFKDFDLSSNCESYEECNICLGALHPNDRVFECYASSTDKHIVHLSCMLHVGNHFTDKTIKCPVCRNEYHLPNGGNLGLIDDNIYNVREHK